MQVEALLSGDWLGHPTCRSPVLLCGDLNALPSSLVGRRLGTRFQDAQRQILRQRPRATFVGPMPTARIDYVFGDASLEVLGIEVPDDELARVASDHLPLIVELRVA